LGSVKTVSVGSEKVMDKDGNLGTEVDGGKLF